MKHWLAWMVAAGSGILVVSCSRTEKQLEEDPMDLEKMAFEKELEIEMPSMEEGIAELLPEEGEQLR